MTLQDIALLRFGQQQIASSTFDSAKALLAWMGAIQAQDYNMSKWAIGLRLPGSNEAQIEKAIETGEILRTHVLRPTWHFVGAADIHWMLALTAPRIKGSFKALNKRLGLEETIFNQSRTLIENALQGNKSLSREALVAVLNQGGIPTNEMRAVFLLMWAELESVLCSGPSQGNAHSYALLQERVPAPVLLDKDEALARLASQYFCSHGPATLADFTWWSGLSVKEAKLGLELTKAILQDVWVEGHQYWYAQQAIMPIVSELPQLLPAFDELIISYTDRRAVVPPLHFDKVISKNAIFKPTIVHNGEAQGIWKRSFQKKQLHLEHHFFEPHQQLTAEQLDSISAAYRAFVGTGV